MRTKSRRVPASAVLVIVRTNALTGFRFGSTRCSNSLRPSGGSESRMAPAMPCTSKYSTVPASCPAPCSASRNVAERQWTRFGVGAVYASSDVYGAGRLWVLLVYAR